MRFSIEHFKDIGKIKWNRLVEKFNGSSHLLTWQNINYQSAFKNIKNVSFSVLDHNDTVALVALAINKSNISKTFSFGNNLIPHPIFSNKVNYSLRKKIYEFIFNFIKQLAKKNKIKQINFVSHPVHFYDGKANLESKNQFEFIMFSSNYLVHNTLINKLSCFSKDQLFSQLSKYHKKNINKIKKKKLIFKTISFKTEKNEIEHHFKNLKKYHFKSAKRKTRPEKTWNIMLKQIIDNEADLFCLIYDTTPISYLYCGRYKNFAWGWSQVNLEKYEKEFMPRHLLEWEVMMYYKKNKLDFYEIGERYFAQEKFKPTKKELLISEFKEKFGSDRFPKVFFNLEI